MDAEKALALTEEIFGKGASMDGITSSIFLVPKSDGSWRPVVNLKPLNVIAHHFTKMEPVRTAKNILQRRLVDEAG